MQSYGHHHHHHFENSQAMESIRSGPDDIEVRVCVAAYPGVFQHSEYRLQYKLHACTAIMFQGLCRPSGVLCYTT
jgi:hypothetical protein